MARPRKYTDEKRVFTVRVRLTPVERIQLVDAANEAGMTLSDFMRVKTISAIPFIKKATPERAAFIRGLAELGKIGSNVNQIARALNRNKTDQAAGFRVPMQIIEQAMHGIETLTRHLIQMVGHGH